MHILLSKQSNFKILGQFENLDFVIMPTRENIRLIARTPFIFSMTKVTILNIFRTHAQKEYHKV